MGTTISLTPQVIFEQTTVRQANRIEVAMWPVVFYLLYFYSFIVFLLYCLVDAAAPKSKTDFSCGSH